MRKKKPLHDKSFGIRSPLFLPSSGTPRLGLVVIEQSTFTCVSIAGTKRAMESCVETVLLRVLAQPRFCLPVPRHTSTIFLRPS